MSILPSADTASARRSSKRKREQVSYVQDDYFDELEIEEAEQVEEGDSDDDGVYGRKRSTKKRVKVKKEPKPKKVKPFPFMRLSPELRNEIYELALTEPDGLTLVSSMNDNRRYIRRGDIAISDSKYYYGKASGRRRWLTQGATRSVVSNRERSLVPNLLATNKQVREEASSYLYKQELHLTDMNTLQLFVASIGSYNHQLLNEVTIRGWAEGGHNFAAFAMLQFCPNMQSIFFDCTLGWYRRPKVLARQIYRDASLFLNAISAAQGSEDAAVQVIQFGDWHFNKKRTVGTHRWNNPVEDGEPVFDQRQRDEFDAELKKQVVQGNRR